MMIYFFLQYFLLLRVKYLILDHVGFSYFKGSNVEPFKTMITKYIKVKLIKLERKTNIDK